MSEAKGIATLVHQQTPDFSRVLDRRGGEVRTTGTDRRALTEGFKSDFGQLRDFANKQ
ncbi:MAG: hypothetical protein Ct9H300mP11_31140 [Chloroflexota bacterium]|nr:MAG: hypothetical protein Ct9H300mP11_31140 [Chloroflexota bacterium]